MISNLFPMRSIKARATVFTLAIFDVSLWTLSFYASRMLQSELVRLGGDEFVVMLSELGAEQAQSTEQAAGVAEKIRASLAAPYQLTLMQPGDQVTTVEHHCSTSIGVVMFINHEANQVDLMKWADAAMYQAKEMGRNGVRFSG